MDSVITRCFTQEIYIINTILFLLHSNLSSVSWNIANPATSLANAYVFLCSENDQGGTVGIAWLSGTCDSTRYGRSSINEYLYNDVVTASVSLFLNTIGNRNKKHLN